MTICTWRIKCYILRWHRELVAQKWDFSYLQKRVGRSRTRGEIIKLVVQMARENPTWGYDRIHGALKNLGVTLCDTTVGNILREHGIEPAPDRQRQTTWKTFLKGHWEVLAAVDFTTIEVWTRGGLVTFYILVVMRLPTRRVEIASVTRYPDSAWVQQVARNLTDGYDGFLRDTRYLLVDRNNKSLPLRGVLEGAETTRGPKVKPGDRILRADVARIQSNGFSLRHKERTGHVALLTVAVMSSILPALTQSDGADRSLRFVPPSARLALDLNRGISIDRQFRTIPPERLMRITREDIQLIKAMGFEFVKLIVNPEPLMSDNHLDCAKKWYLQEIVELATHESLPVVVCIHPEWEFKKRILSNADQFAKFLGFLEDTAQFLANGWGPKQLALQLMTEPGANSLNWNDLQPQMWHAARRAMPEHTLILAGDQVGKIDGLITTKPVNDANVMYSFTFYEPFVLTLQGGEWLTPKLWSHMGSIPYPSSPEVIAEREQAILERIPTDPPGWRTAAEGMLIEYGNARWNKEKIAGCVKKLVDWNKSYGGGLKIWCAEFGCYQRTIDPEDRYRYLKDVRETLEENGIGWAYWSYNETFTVMTPDRQPFGPAKSQTPDEKMLEVLFGPKRK